jgi:NAD-dependent oxidoreductase involved in siderophore biosynthesis
MPASQDPYGPVAWSSLIAMRKEPWMAGFCDRKASSLRVAAVGRGPDAMRVADAYCAVLAALRDGASDRRLRRLLEAASEAEAGWAGQWLRIGNGER